MVLHWRRCGRAGGRQTKKEKKQGDLFDINTGAGEWAVSETWREQTNAERTGANPHQQGNAVTDSWFYQWFKKKRVFPLKWLIKTSVRNVPWKLHTCKFDYLIKYPWYKRKVERYESMFQSRNDRKTSITMLSKKRESTNRLFLTL